MSQQKSPQGAYDRDQGILLARWIFTYLNQRRHGLECINQLVQNSSDKASGPALRLADAAWAAHWRERFATPALITEEENRFQHLLANHRDATKAADYRVWEAIGQYVALRTTLFGSPLLVGQPLPPLEADSPLRRHQRMLYRLVMRAKEHRQAWLHQLLGEVEQITPNPGMLAALELLAEMLWWRLANGQDERVKQRQPETQRAFWAHYRANPWLATTPVANLVKLLPSAAHLRLT
ncbi:MAG: hypothetical protein INF43_01280 [Alphaproteobacteria bacterium]|nr:hypothetical protein [Alphaproteobacteria bacterium]